EPHSENKVCDFHGRVALHAEWWPVNSEAGHTGDGGDGRPPSGARGNRSQTHRVERRSESSYPEEGHGRSRKTLQRCRLRRAHRICERRESPLFPGRPSAVDFTHPHRAVPEL